ncbi:hypothetical protein [Neisseria animalis]|uniref:Uncharacterized protein n=1 Tax=Neisseria animalis TaxID=492 RepID=A0A5P3MP57_NEIAN|nr:hypothetical protein [Neisseria animalis]QEY23314.1 hypothetical protein D0T90_01365 [Neisseria animalis]ROW33162.1 hypothetical protein CGZ60_00090 [Neisseria animalis]VEE08666.1 phage associated protein [Neisseria animalis]
MLTKKLRAKTAAAFNKAKLASGERRVMGINAKAAEMDIIDAAIAKAGGSKTKALVAICTFYLENA